MTFGHCELSFLRTLVNVAKTFVFTCKTFSLTEPSDKSCDSLRKRFDKDFQKFVDCCFLDRGIIVSNSVLTNIYHLL